MCVKKSQIQNHPILIFNSVWKSPWVSETFQFSLFGFVKVFPDLPLKIEPLFLILRFVVIKYLLCINIMGHFWHFYFVVTS